MFDTHPQSHQNGTFNAALRQACTELLHAGSPSAWNSIPVQWKGINFPAWFRMGVWYRNMYPTLSFTSIAEQVIDGCYDPLSIMPPATLHWDPLNQKRLPPQSIYAVWHWIENQSRFATVSTVIALNTFRGAPKARSLAALLMGMHLHDTSRDTLKDGGHNLRADLEIALSNFPKATWPNVYPRLIQRNIRLAVAFWRDSHASTCACGTCTLFAKRKAG